MGWPQYFVLFLVLFVKIPSGVYKVARNSKYSGAETVGGIVGHIAYYICFLWILYIGGFFN